MSSTCSCGGSDWRLEPGKVRHNPRWPCCYTGNFSEGQGMTAMDNYRITDFSVHIQQSNVALGWFALRYSWWCAIRRSQVNDPSLVIQKGWPLPEEIGSAVPCPDFSSLLFDN